MKARGKKAVRGEGVERVSGARACVVCEDSDRSERAVQHFLEKPRLMIVEVAKEGMHISRVLGNQLQ